jgi:hypothetical protein
MAQHRFSKTCPCPRVLVSQLRKLEKTDPDRVGYSRRLPDFPNKKEGREYWVIFPKDYNTKTEELDIEDLL